jgi:hypothetical protein
MTSRAHVVQALCDALPPGSPVYCVIRTVARSGMTCTLDLYTVAANVPRRITLSVAVALTMRTNIHGALIVRGWGKEAPQSVVMNLSYALHGTSGAGRGLVPNGECEVPDESNYRAGYSLRCEVL